jgi:hypothetical protein
MHRLPAALATPGEPGAHGFRQALRLDAVTRFDETYGNRKRVVKLGLAREVAHTKIVEPFERAWLALGAYEDVDTQLLSEHEASIANAAPPRQPAPNSLLRPNQRTRIELYLKVRRRPQQP